MVVLKMVAPFDERQRHEFTRPMNRPAGKKVETAAAKRPNKAQDKKKNIA
jgi:hypothetical protein